MTRIRSLLPLLVRFITHTLGVRFLLALAISITLWILFTGEQNPVREGFFSAEIPVETSRLGDGLVVSRTAPSTVRLRIAAPRDIWESLTADKFSAVVDLFAVGVGLHEIPIEVASSDGRISIIATDPETITVSLEERREKEVPVRVDLVGDPPEGYRFQLPELLPDLVSIIGPSSRVDLVDAVWVSVEMDEVRSTVNLTKRAIPRDAQGEDVTGVQLDPPVVQVTVPVELAVTNKDVPVRVNIVGQPAPGYLLPRYLTTPATATLIGAPEVLNGLLYLSTETIRVEGATGTVTQTVELVQPPGVEVAGSNEVVVTIFVVPIVASVQTQVAVTALNLRPGLEIEVFPPTASVTLGGLAPLLRELQPGSVIVSLNLSGLGPGSYALSPDTNAPTDVKVERINPSQFIVVVRDQTTSAPTPVPVESPAPAEEPPPATPTPAPDASATLRR